MQTTLNELLAFRHDGVINRYKRDFPADAARAEDLFTDLMTFFWASKKHELERLSNPDIENLDFTFIMDEEMLEIDKMWHIFLLYTKDYMDFCEKYFGEFLHHLPDVVPNRKITPFDVEMNLQKFLSYVFDNLGEDFVRRWFRLSSQEAEAV
ncbi:MAG: hypothetical protein AABZ31_01790 [Bdellovibrionota bacterium]